MNQRGFTLPELIVAICLILVLLVLSIFLLHPADYTAQEQDSERRLDIAKIARSLKQYKQHQGTFPEIPTNEVSISMAKGAYDICQRLPAQYIKAVPLDPTVGTAIIEGAQQSNEKDVACNAKDLAYISGYKIRQNKDGSVTVSAPYGNSGPLEIILR